MASARGLQPARFLTLTGAPCASNKCTHSETVADSLHLFIYLLFSDAINKLHYTASKYSLQTLYKYPYTITHNIHVFIKICKYKNVNCKY